MPVYLDNKYFEALIRQYQDAERLVSKYEMIYSDKKLRSDKKKWVAAQTQFKFLQTDLARCFDLIARNLLTKFQTLTHHWYEDDDAAQQAVLYCFGRPLVCYREEKGTAFGYFTTSCLTSMRQMWRTNKNYHDLQRAYSEEQIAEHGPDMFER